jgi:hypothetical protein
VEEILTLGPDVLTPDEVRILVTGAEEIRIHGKTVHVRDVRMTPSGGHQITYTTEASGYPPTLTTSVSG